METIMISKSAAQKAYSSADDTIKKALADLIGKEHLSTDITDRIKSYEDACLELGIPQMILLDYQRLSTFDPEGDFICHQMKVITSALNEKWIADWSNSDQRKWFPYFEYKKSLSGFGFSNAHYAYWLTGTSLGSRHCFKSEKLATYFGKQFEKLINQYLILQSK